MYVANTAMPHNIFIELLWKIPLYLGETFESVDFEASEAEHEEGQGKLANNITIPTHKYSDKTDFNLNKNI